MIFSCSECNERYSLDDITQGKYFVSTGVCSNCYSKKAKNRSECFGKKKKYDFKLLACSECPDSTICKAFVHYPDQF